MTTPDKERMQADFDMITGKLHVDVTVGHIYESLNEKQTKATIALLMQAHVLEGIFGGMSEEQREAVKHLVGYVIDSRTD